MYLQNTRHGDLKRFRDRCNAAGNIYRFASTQGGDSQTIVTQQIDGSGYIHAAKFVSVYAQVKHVFNVVKGQLQYRKTRYQGGENQEIELNFRCSVSVYMLRFLFMRYYFIYYTLKHQIFQYAELNIISSSCIFFVIYKSTPLQI